MKWVSAGANVDRIACPWLIRKFADSEAEFFFVPADTGKKVAIVPIAGELDVVWYNQKRNRLYCAIGRPGVIDVLDILELVVDEQREMEEGAHTIAFDLARQRIYAFLPGSCRASAYEEV